MNPAKQLHINSSLTPLGSDSMSEEVNDKQETMVQILNPYPYL